MKRRGWLLLAGLVILLATAIIIGNALPSPPADSPEMLLDAVWDRIGVTKWSEALGWLELEMDGELAEIGPDTPVWVSRNGRKRFHSVPLCGAMKAPMRLTMEEAVLRGFRPCSVCWVEIESD